MSRQVSHLRADVSPAEHSAIAAACPHTDCAHVSPFSCSGWAHAVDALGGIPDGWAKVDGQWVRLSEMCAECGIDPANHESSGAGSCHESGDPAYQPLVFVADQADNASPFVLAAGDRMVRAIERVSEAYVAGAALSPDLVFELTLARREWESSRGRAQ